MRARTLVLLALGAVAIACGSSSNPSSGSDAGDDAPVVPPPTDSGSGDSTPAMDAPASDANDAPTSDAPPMQDAPSDDATDSAAGDAGNEIACGANACPFGSDFCCATGSGASTTFACQSTNPPTMCPAGCGLTNKTTPILCDTSADCGGGVCCGAWCGSRYGSVTCMAAASCTGAMFRVVCSAGKTSGCACPMGTTPKPSAALPGYDECQ